MDMRAEVWSPLQNASVWLGAWLHGHESTDDLLEAWGELGLDCDITLLSQVRSVARLDTCEPALRLVLSGPGEPPALPAGSEPSIAASRGDGAIVFDGSPAHALVDGTIYAIDQPLPAPQWLSPGDADRLLSDATNDAARLIEASGYRTDALPNPRLTVGTLSDFYDTPGLPGSTSARAAKLFARADTVAAIVETVTQTMNDHSVDPQLLALLRHIRAARMAGVAYAVRDFAR